MKTEICGEIRLCDFALTPANFKTEFIVGLKRYPKVLPCKLFCDEHGSRLFVPDEARCTERHRVEIETKNMKTKQIKIPGPEHPIFIQRNPDRVVVSVAGRVVADICKALTRQ
jgi:hypothetical protein